MSPWNENTVQVIRTLASSYFPTFFRSSLRVPVRMCWTKSHLLRTYDRSERVHLHCKRKFLSSFFLSTHNFSASFDIIIIFSIPPWWLLVFISKVHCIRLRKYVTSGYKKVKLLAIITANWMLLFDLFFFFRRNKTKNTTEL